MATITAELFDAGVRVDRVIWLPGAIVDLDSPSDALRDFVEDDFPESAEHDLCKALPVLKSFAELDEVPEIEEIGEALYGVSGFLVKAETPVRRKFGTGGGYTWSWGHVYYSWLYAKDEASIAEVVTAWAAARFAEDHPNAEVSA
jgi:hypothetical protein